MVKSKNLLNVYVVVIVRPFVCLCLWLDQVTDVVIVGGVGFCEIIMPGGLVFLAQSHPPMWFITNLLQNTRNGINGVTCVLAFSMEVIIFLSQ